MSKILLGFPNLNLKGLEKESLTTIILEDFTVAFLLNDLSLSAFVELIFRFLF